MKRLKVCKILESAVKKAFRKQKNTHFSLKLFLFNTILIPEKTRVLASGTRLRVLTPQTRVIRTRVTRVGSPTGKPLTSSDFQCDRDTEDKTQSEDFKAEMMKVVEDSKYHYNAEEMLLTYPLMMEVMSKNSTTSIDMGTWSTKAGFKKTSGYQHSEIPRFFRIGTVPTTPWAYYELGTK